MLPQCHMPTVNSELRIHFQLFKYKFQLRGAFLLFSLALVESNITSCFLHNNIQIANVPVLIESVKHRVELTL